MNPLGAHKRKTAIKFTRENHNELKKNCFICGGGENDRVKKVKDKTLVMRLNCPL